MKIRLANYFALFNVIFRYFSCFKVLKLIGYLDGVSAIIDSFSDSNIRELISNYILNLIML